MGQSFLIVDMGGTKAEAVAVLYVGGKGLAGLCKENGQVTFYKRNFLPRSIPDFIRNGVVPVLVDVPSDQARGLSDSYRIGDLQATDCAAIVAELKKRIPGLRIFLVGTSRGTLSVASLGARIGDGVAGIVLSASLFYIAKKPVLAAANWSRIKTRLLFAHHRDDACSSTPYSEAAKLSSTFPLISVRGGKPAQDDNPCEPLTPHGFYGKEPQTVDAIAGWMLDRQFAKEIE